MNMQLKDRNAGSRYVVTVLMMTAALAAASFVRNETWSDATVLWRDAMKKSPAKARPAYRLGMVYLGREEYQKAYVVMAKARALDPEYFSQVLSPAGRYGKTGNFDEAVREYQKMMETNPVDPFLHLSLGNLYREAGRFVQAEREFFTALQLDPVNAAARAALDQLYESQDSR